MDRLTKVIRLMIVWILISFSNPVSAQFFSNPLSEAVDNYRYEFLNSTFPGFQRVTDTSNFDGDSAWSGSVKDDDVSVMYVQLQGGEEITWDWKVDSEENYDFLAFFVIDSNFETVDELTQLISGSVDWTRSSSKIPEGPHEAIWAYVKDDILARGTDSGWVDRVVIEGGPFDASTTLPPIINFLLEEPESSLLPDQANLYPPVPDPQYNEPILVIESEEGEYLGGGSQFQYSAENSQYWIRSNVQRGIQIKVQGSNDESTIDREIWVLQLAYGNERLNYGEYKNAQRFPFNDSDMPGISISKDDVECAAVEGGFTIYDIEYDQDKISKLILDFEVRCNGEEKSLRGSLKFDSSLGNYIWPSHPVSDQFFPPLPDPVDSAPLVRIYGAPTKPTPRAQSFQFDKSNSFIEITESSTGMIRINILGEGSDKSRQMRSITWDMAHGEETITVGQYLNATDSFPISGTQNYLSVSFPSSTCGQSSGEFEIYEIIRDSEGNITKFTADFILVCPFLNDTISGSIKYDSTLPQPIPSPPPEPVGEMFPVITVNSLFTSQANIIIANVAGEQTEFSLSSLTTNFSAVISNNALRRIHLRLSKSFGEDIFDLEFQSARSDAITPGGEYLTVGTYGDLGQRIFSSPKVVMEFGYNGRAGLECDGADGRFRVYELEIDALGEVEKLFADFEHYCRDDQIPTVGSIRYSR